MQSKPSPALAAAAPHRCGDPRACQAFSLVGYVDENGFRAELATATHVLLNCHSPVHATPQTYMVPR